jgi:hypothetical protein
MGNQEEKRLLARQSHKWEDYIEMVLREIGCGGVDWFQLAQDRDQ